MAQGRKFLEAFGSVPLIRLQRSAVRYRLHITEPGDTAAVQQDCDRRESIGSALHNRIDTEMGCCEVGP
ncbi:MAG: hypothetical protein RLN69_01740 [Woeseiaceae bacterium]